MTNHEEIKKEAKQIMDNFMNALKDVDIEEEFVLERDNSYREEGTGKVANPQFQNRFLSNAKKTDGNAIVANKGDWTK